MNVFRTRSRSGSVISSVAALACLTLSFVVSRDQEAIGDCFSYHTPYPNSGYCPQYCEPDQSQTCAEIPDPRIGCFYLQNVVCQDKSMTSNRTFGGYDDCDNYMLFKTADC